MNPECYIWVHACVVLTSTLDNHFQYLHPRSVIWNIETTTLSRNQNHISRVYLLHHSIYIQSAAILSTCFQLDIVHPFCSLEKSNLNVVSSVVKLILGFFFTAINRDHRIRNRSNFFSNKYFIFAHFKYYIGGNQREDYIWWNVVYCWIFHCGYIFLPCCVWLVENQDKNNSYISCLNNKKA